MCEPITVTKPTPAQMAAAEADYLMRSFDGTQGVEPMFSEFYTRRLSQPTDIRITHRCPRMGEHMQDCPCHPRLPIPCDECYSLLTTSQRIPYEPNRVILSND